jgi:hypothetical protein
MSSSVKTALSPDEQIRKYVAYISGQVSDKRLIPGLITSWRKEHNKPSATVKTSVIEQYTGLEITFENVPTLLTFCWHNITICRPLILDIIDDFESANEFESPTHPHTHSTDSIRTYRERIRTISQSAPPTTKQPKLTQSNHGKVTTNSQPKQPAAYQPKPLSLKTTAEAKAQAADNYPEATTTATAATTPSTSPKATIPATTTTTEATVATTAGAKESSTTEATAVTKAGAPGTSTTEATTVTTAEATEREPPKPQRIKSTTTSSIAITPLHSDLTNTDRATLFDRELAKDTATAALEKAAAEKDASTKAENLAAAAANLNGLALQYLRAHEKVLRFTTHQKGWETHLANNTVPSTLHFGVPQNMFRDDELQARIKANLARVYMELHVDYIKIDIAIKTATALNALAALKASYAPNNLEQFETVVAKINHDTEQQEADRAARAFDKINRVQQPRDNKPKREDTRSTRPAPTKEEKAERERIQSERDRARNRNNNNQQQDRNLNQQRSKSTTDSKRTPQSPVTPKPTATVHKSSLELAFPDKKWGAASLELPGVTRQAPPTKFPTNNATASTSKTANGPNSLAANSHSHSQQPQPANSHSNNNQNNNRNNRSNDNNRNNNYNNNSRNNNNQNYNNRDTARGQNNYNRSPSRHNNNNGQRNRSPSRHNNNYNQRNRSPSRHYNNYNRDDDRNSKRARSPSSHGNRHKSTDSQRYYSPVETRATPPAEQQPKRVHQEALTNNQQTPKQPTAFLPKPIIKPTEQQPAPIATASTTTPTTPDDTELFKQFLQFQQFMAMQRK